MMEMIKFNEIQTPIIPLYDVPRIIIIKGPSAVFGRALSVVKKGSIIFWIREKK